MKNYSTRVREISFPIGSYSLYIEKSEKKQLFISGPSKSPVGLINKRYMPNFTKTFSYLIYICIYKPLAYLRANTTVSYLQELFHLKTFAGNSPFLCNPHK